MNFQFYNKTDQPIYLHLDESFYILNSIAHNYYKNRTYSSSTGKQVAVSQNAFSIKYNTAYRAGASSLKSSGISIKEEKTVIIPAKTAKIIVENYSINSTRYRNCNLTKYPTKKEGKSALSFNKGNSPFTFSNRLTYSLSPTKENIHVEHEFFVKEIINYTEKEMFVSKKDTVCGTATTNTLKYFKDISNKDFYIKYIRTVN